MRNIIWFLHAIKESLFKKAYGFILPRANYSPWLIDDTFQPFWNKIHSHTLVDKYRCFELWELVSQTKNVRGIILEVGVWKGGTGAILAKSAEHNDITDTVYLCDTFKGVVKASHHDSAYAGGEHAETSLETVKALIQNFSLKNVKILKGIFPEEVVHLILEERIRFCHIDVDVYLSGQDIFNWVWPRMDIGAVMVFDDYGFSSCDGITKLVNELKMRTDLVFIYNLNGHAIFVKLH